MCLAPMICWMIFGYAGSGVDPTSMERLVSATRAGVEGLPIGATVDLGGRELKDSAAC